MIKLATVFSGIGAIEHALQRMGLEHKIVFACDNGDIEILTKDFGMNIDIIGKELNKLTKTIKTLQFNDEIQDLYKEQLANMRFCNEKLSHFILLGQTNYEGNITNLGVGQMAGIPAVVFSSLVVAVSVTDDISVVNSSVVGSFSVVLSDIVSFLPHPHKTHINIIIINKFNEIFFIFSS